MQITQLLKSKGLSLFKHGKGRVVSHLINNLQGMASLYDNRKQCPMFFNLSVRDYES